MAPIAFNFTNLLFHILRLMAETKMKEPLVILDEPEISLHSHMIDELAEIFSQCRYDVRVLLATHSARLIRNILVQEGGENQLYRSTEEGRRRKSPVFQMFRQDSE